METLGRFRALLAVVAVILAGALVPAQTTVTLTLAAARLSGEPVGGLRVAVEPPGVATALTVPLGPEGRAQVVYTTTEPSMVLPPVRLDGGDWMVLEVQGGMGRRRGTLEGGAQLVVVPRQLDALTAAERPRVVARMAHLMRDVRLQWEATRTAPASRMARLAAMLEGIREEDMVLAMGEPPAATPAPGATPAPEPRRWRVLVVDEQGNRVGGRGVVLFTLDEATGLVRVAASTRTRANGEAMLPLPAGAGYHRVEVAPAGDGRVGRTAPRFLAADAPAPADDTVVLRPPAERLSGMVFNRDVPARGVHVEGVQAGRPALRAVVDEHGFFDLGPMEPGPARLTLRRAAGATPHSLTVEVNGAELVLPFDLIAAEP
jgi:hypothetical protein